MSKIGTQIGDGMADRLRQAAGGKPRPQRPCMFYLMRRQDHSGVSGTGVVAEGIEFTNGKVAMAWLTDTSSICVYDSMEDLVIVHGHGGSSEVIYGRHDTDSGSAGVRSVRPHAG